MSFCIANAYTAFSRYFCMMISQNRATNYALFQSKKNAKKNLVETGFSPRKGFDFKRLEWYEEYKFYYDFYG